MVVADLNFDGLDDFGVAVDHGCDNGKHYAYYIQQPNHKFKFNRYLTDEVMWFPYKFDTIKKTFTNSVHCTAYSKAVTTFKYDTIKQNWRIIKQALVDY
jgi:hypothetical protein